MNIDMDDKPIKNRMIQNAYNHKHIFAMMVVKGIHMHL